MYPHERPRPYMQVQILCGKDKGMQGRVVSVARNVNRVFVGGFNTVSVT